MIALLGAVSIWGSTFVVTKFVLADFGPFTIAALRFATALAVLAPLAARRGFRWTFWLRPRFLLLGLTGVTLHYGLQNVALLLTTAGSAALIVGGIPAATALFSVWFLGESMTRRQVVGITLSVAGVALLAGAGLDASDVAALVGNLLVVGSVVAWAAYTVIGKKLADDYDSVVVTSASFGAGLLMLAPIALVESFVSPPSPSWPGVAALLYLALGASALTFYLWNYALHFVKASVAGPFINLVPVIGLGLAMLIGERIGALQIAGGAVVIAGVWLSNQRTEEER